MRAARCPRSHGRWARLLLDAAHTHASVAWSESRSKDATSYVRLSLVPRWLHAELHDSTPLVPLPNLSDPLVPLPNRCR